MTFTNRFDSARETSRGVPKQNKHADSTLIPPINPNQSQFGGHGVNGSGADEPLPGPCERDVEDGGSQVREQTSNRIDDCIENRNPRYPLRQRKPPPYLKDYVTSNNPSDEEYINSCETKIIPGSYHEAITSPDANKWKLAMEKEMNSLKENNTFTLTTVPENKNVVGGKWVYNIKKDDKNNEEYKARYVAKGYSQIKDVDYYETYAPTTKMTTIRILMQFAVQYDLIIHQMDVKSAYLNAKIDCDIFTQQPEGYIVPGKEGLVWKLNKSLYGLKQSGKNWNDLLSKELLLENFNQSIIDPCMFVKVDENKRIIILVWVDDILIAANNLDTVTEVKTLLKQKFDMKDLGQISRFLGVDFIIKPNEIQMNQRAYTEKILEKFNMLDCKPRLTPCEQKLPFSKEAKAFDPTKYREAIGSLVYLSTCTRPDISWVVNKLSQYNQNPTIEHWNVVKHVLRYLKGTLNFCLSFRKCESGLKLTGYTDADWGSPEDRKSTSGYCFSLNEEGPVIAWKSILR